ncbi:hypothetical protein [uncultured Enterovirga sp.]|uniref:hypothetical protein n=1 Tax=uncultured Enterovirga sp. TaxID=2026352 RepID=UPI0035CBA7D9
MEQSSFDEVRSEGGEVYPRQAALSSRNRLSLFHDSGHSPFYEEPARYNRELAAFVINAARG